MTGTINMTELESAAQKARLTGQVRSFLDWLGEGRKLTQTGRIGLADARYLVEFLGTGDVIDPEIGGKYLRPGPAKTSQYCNSVPSQAAVDGLARSLVSVSPTSPFLLAP